MTVSNAAVKSRSTRATGERDMSFNTLRRAVSVMWRALKPDRNVIVLIASKPLFLKFFR